MEFARAGGIICHPTSFPSRYGIGDLGPGAYDFVDWLAGARQKLWQVLPLGPTGYGDSPYQSFSAFAGNPVLISPDRLLQEGLLPSGALDNPPDLPVDHVDFGAVIPFKQSLFEASYSHWCDHGTNGQRTAFEAFRATHGSWLPDYAFFMALKGHFGGQSWLGWPRAVRVREPEVLVSLRSQLSDRIRLHEYLQWQFRQQWEALRDYVHAQGISIIGDLPIFVSEDSADVWGRAELFKLDGEGRATVVAGVPPDGFSDTGQRWGNPHYNWKAMASEGYRWWIERMRMTLGLLDIVRVDHFRGFEAAWEIPASEPTAVNGKWVKAPGHELFRALVRDLGELPVIAEDLGVITEEVESLRAEFGLPGMKVLEFAFAVDTTSKYLPHNYRSNYVAYPGTHDNNTVIGWFDEPNRTPVEKWNTLHYLNSDGSDLAWDLIRAVWSSVANSAVALLQDVMSLGAEARMNHPSTTSGNWQWRFTPEMLSDELRARMMELSSLYQR
jgi:4-alpha-glucanotransferase